MWEDRFDEIWLVDFEFLGRSTGGAHREGNRPHPVCMVAHEYRSGRTIRLWQDEFGPAPPYRIDDRVLIVAYYASAEMGCHLALRWARPTHLLDLYVEFKNRLGGRKSPVGVGLLGALTLHGLDGARGEEKDDMRALVLRGGPWTQEEKQSILDYCAADVMALCDLLPRMANYIDLPRALLRGRYMWSAAWMEWIGIPIDVAALTKILTQWESVKLQLIAAVDVQYHVYDGSHFRLDRFQNYLHREGLLSAWPRTATGQLRVDGDTFEEMVKTFPQLQNLKQLKSSIDKLKLNSITVGDDGRNRTILSAFASKTARNQPSNAKFVFLGDTWLRSVIRPAAGWALAYCDWEQQEFGIAAALSGDPNMIQAYVSGDCYLEFAKLAGAVPAPITRDNYKPGTPGYATQPGSPIDYEPIRNRYKQCVLAVQYGQGVNGLAARTGLSIIEARELMQRHRETFRRFWQWSTNILNTATFRLELPTMFGWWLDTTEAYAQEHEGKARPGCTPRTIQNYLMQASGSEMLRIACIRADERDIRLCAPIHDALLVEGCIEEIDHVVAETEECMRQASRDVLCGFELRTETKIVRWPDRYADKRGQSMWAIVAGLVGIDTPPYGRATP
jgi:hypothetical protein